VPLLGNLIDHFRKPPVRLGGFDHVQATVSATGDRVALHNGEEVHVIAATARDLNESGFSELASAGLEGFFLIDGSGSSGACEALASLGVFSFGLLHAAAWGFRVPAPSTVAPATTPPTPPTPPTTPSHVQPRVASAPTAPHAADGFTLGEALRTPQLYYLALGSFGISMIGLPFIHAGAFMINDIFSTALGSGAAALAATFPAHLKCANVAGRFAWGPVLDRTSAATVVTLFGVAVPAVVVARYSTSLVLTDPATALHLFQAGAVRLA